MTWSKTLKGSFAEIRDALNTVAADVQASDVKGKADEKVREAHHMQAQVAVAAALQITANTPFQAASRLEEDRDMTFVLAGGSEKNGGGSVSITYKIGPQKLKADKYPSTKGSKKSVK